MARGGGRVLIELASTKVRARPPFRALAHQQQGLSKTTPKCVWICPSTERILNSCGCPTHLEGGYCEVQTEQQPPSLLAAPLPLLPMAPLPETAPLPLFTSCREGVFSETHMRRSE